MIIMRDTKLHNILKSSNDRSDFDKSDSYREITIDELFGASSLETGRVEKGEKSNDFI